MKKFFTLLLASFLTILFVGCGSNKEAENEKPQIYTSFYAIYDFAKQIAGDNADIYNLVPVGSEPHDWEPTAQDMAKLSKADLVLYNGLDMEHWVEHLDEALLGESSNFVQVSEGVKINEEVNDPHIWLDPENVITISENIYNALCEVDPENKANYESNFHKYSDMLKTLDGTFQSIINQGTNKKIVVSHNAYGYLCSAYGLEQIAIDSFSSDGEPSPEKMMELINIVKENNIKYVFYEELGSKKTAQTLADETGAELLPLNSFEGISEEDVNNGVTYTSVMTKNIENIKKAID